MKFIIGRKIGMTQIFKKDGKIIPVTLVSAKENILTQIKTKEKDGYNGVQVGFERLPQRKVTKSRKTKPFRFLREFRIPEDLKIDSKVGEKLFKVSDFKEGERVRVSGISKGKGFQGAVKRWGFKGLGASHGVRHHERTIGSIGSRFPQRVLKGKKMPGHMGQERITLKKVEIVAVIPDQDIIALKGALPGAKNSIVEILSE